MSHAALLDDVAARWASLADHPERVERLVRIAGRDLHIVVVGTDLAAAFLPSLEAHEPARGEPVDEIGAWDASATGVELPSVVTATPRWTGTRDGEAVVEVARLQDGSIRTADRDARRFLLGVPSTRSLSSWERGAPLRRQLLWALWPDAALVHAAAVGTPDGVALLAGRSGAGKSSTAIACARAGMGYLGDDHCAITAGAPPRVHLLHASARLVEAELEYAGAAIAPTPGVDVDKVLVWPQRGGGVLQRSGPLRAILLTTTGDEPAPRLEPVRAAIALREIGPSMLWQQHIAPDRELANLRALLTSVPIHRLHLSADRAANPTAIAHAITAARR